MKKTIDMMNLKPDNALYKSVSMLMEIVQDGLDMRLQVRQSIREFIFQLNDYIQCFILQSEMKLEDMTIKEALAQAKMNIGFEMTREAAVNKMKV